MQGALGTDGIIDGVIAAEQHFATEHAFIELRTCSALDALVGILGIEDVRCAHARGLFDLEGMTSHDAYASLGRECAQDLQGE